jgi:D-glycerate 3-kinase
VPGTHDLDALQDALDRIADGAISSAFPRFDKAIDDRLPENRWQRIDHIPDIVLLEGWCVGATPQPSLSLFAPINDLERTEDPDGRWRAFVNQRLATDYRSLFARFDALVMLRVADFQSVWQGRKRQEDKLRQQTGDRSGHVMSDAELRRFLQHFERLTRHMLDSMPALADALIEGEDIICRGSLAASVP